jgi:integrase
VVSFSVYIGVCVHIEENAGSETGRALGKITIALIHFHQRLIGLLIYRHGLRISEACDLRLGRHRPNKRTITVRIGTRHMPWFSEVCRSARKIAANIAKLPELLKRLLGQSSSSMALTDRVASRNSSAVAKRLGRLAIDLRNELVGPR